MLLSVFTPTNNPQYLTQCFQSLLQQDYQNWEWVLAPNGMPIDNIPEDIRKHPQVKIHVYSGPPNVGAMKRFCCEKAIGDVFVEFDHDDKLVPGVLSQVVQQVEQGAGFIYSDTARFSDDESGFWSCGYSDVYGWETYPFVLNGLEYKVSKTFDISARSLCEVFFSPDHIRCWTRDAYYRAGGHDPKLEVGDDHDLICRTYIAKVPFGFTGGCGYLYREHSGNTVKSHNEKIQYQQADNRNKHIYNLIDEWTRRSKLGYLDIRTDNKQDAWGDLAATPSNTLGAIRAYDFVSTLPLAQMDQFMQECWRVLAPGGWLCIATPDATGKGAFAPHFKSYWTEKTFEYWSVASLAQYAGLTQAKFQIVRCFKEFSGDKRKIPGVDYVIADLCALKGQRQPGRVFI